MKRIGISMALLTIALIFLLGCEEETTGVDETGFQVRFVALELREIERVVEGSIEVDTIALEQPALTFAVWVFVDDEYQGRASTDEPKFFSFPSGTYDMYVRSNMRKITEDTFYLWRRRFTVNEGNITFMTFHTDTVFRGL
jgi:hypothetical protein